MTEPPLAVLAEARKVLERYMFDGETCRDDAEVCQKIDDLLPSPVHVAVPAVEAREAA
jgi:hypothetical protein